MSKKLRERRGDGVHAVAVRVDCVARAALLELFAQSEDDWAIEGLIAQLSLMRALGGEGGVFAAVGCRLA